jgi:hypothetical protein
MGDDLHLHERDGVRAPFASRARRWVATASSVCSRSARSDSYGTDGFRVGAQSNHLLGGGM